MTATTNAVTPITDQRRACIDLLYGGQEPEAVYERGVHERVVRSNRATNRERRLLTDEQAREAYRRCHAGEAGTWQVAREYGVPLAVMYKLVRGISYRDVTGGPDAAA